MQMSTSLTSGTGSQGPSVKYRQTLFQRLRLTKSFSLLVRWYDAGKS